MVASISDMHFHCQSHLNNVTERNQDEQESYNGAFYSRACCRSYGNVFIDGHSFYGLGDFDAVHHKMQVGYLMKMKVFFSVSGTPSPTSTSAQCKVWL